MILCNGFGYGVAEGRLSKAAGKIAKLPLFNRRKLIFTVVSFPFPSDIPYDMCRNVDN